MNEHLYNNVIGQFNISLIKMRNLRSQSYRFPSLKKKLRQNMGGGMSMSEAHLKIFNLFEKSKKNR